MPSKEPFTAVHALTTLCWPKKCQIAFYAKTSPNPSPMTMCSISHSDNYLKLAKTLTVISSKVYHMGLRVYDIHPQFSNECFVQENKKREKTHFNKNHHGTNHLKRTVQGQMSMMSICKEVNIIHAKGVVWVN